MKPFSCGTQFMDWTIANCDRCTKDQKCDIQEALNVGVITGEVTEEIAKRMDARPDSLRYCWPCGEWEPTEKWKAEWQRQQKGATAGRD